MVPVLAHPREDRITSESCMTRDTAPRRTGGPRSRSEDEDILPIETSGWRVIGLCAFYVLLGVLAAALSAAIGTLPYWSWPAG